MLHLLLRIPPCPVLLCAALIWIMIRMKRVPTDRKRNDCFLAVCALALPANITARQRKDGESPPLDFPYRENSSSAFEL